MNQKLKIKFYINDSEDVGNTQRIEAAQLEFKEVDHITADVRVYDNHGCMFPDNIETCVIISRSTMTDINDALLETLEDTVILKLCRAIEIEIDVEIQTEHYTYIYINQVELFNALKIKL